MKSAVALALVILAIFIPASNCDNILVVSDNADISSTHSAFLAMLNKNHHVDVAYSFGKEKIQLKKYDRFNYQHLIVMGLSVKGIHFPYVESSSQIKIDDIVSFFD